MRIMKSNHFQPNTYLMIIFFHSVDLDLSKSLYELQVPPETRLFIEEIPGVVSVYFCFICFTLLYFILIIFFSPKVLFNFPLWFCCYLVT